MLRYLESNSSEAKRQKTNGYDLEHNWTVINNDNKPTIMYRFFDDNIKEKSTVIGFDLDGTLITTKSGKKFAVDKNDWKLLCPAIPDVLKELYDSGHYLVIISNQNGISQGHSTTEDLQNKVDQIISKLGVPIDFICSFQKDIYRKPRTGSWDFVLEKQMSKVIPSSEFLHRCIYVGDAAGRPKQGTKSKDFSATDLKFALNLGIEFKTPEQFFLKSTQRLDCDRALADLGFRFSQLTDAAVASTSTETETAAVSHSPSDELFSELSGSPEIVLLIGPPASGKSTLARTRFVNHFRINQDQLKTRNRCLDVAMEKLLEGKSVVIDNTNASKTVRVEWIQLAKGLKIPIRSVAIEISKDICMHLALYRELNPTSLTPQEDRRHIPDVVIHTFFKNYEAPQLKESFVRVDSIAFVPTIPDDEKAAKTEASDNSYSTSRCWSACLAPSVSS
eukprot:gene9924-20637_t